MGTLKNWWSFTRKDLHFPAISCNGKYIPFNMEVIWASNQSLLHWGSGSMNEIHYHFCALSKCYFTLARSNSSCPPPCWLRLYFRYKKRDHFSSDTQKTFIWYTKWVLISMWGGPVQCSVANSGHIRLEKGWWLGIIFSKSCYFQHFENVSSNPCHTVKQVKLKTLTWKNQNLLGNQRNFSRKKVTIPVRPLYGRNRANPHFSCPYANWIK